MGSQAGGNGFNEDLFSHSNAPNYFHFVRTTNRKLLQSTCERRKAFSSIRESLLMMAA
jgi:hypothetical protein